MTFYINDPLVQENKGLSEILNAQAARIAALEAELAKAKAVMVSVARGLEGIVDAHGYADALREAAQ